MPGLGTTQTHCTEGSMHCTEGSPPAGEQQTNVGTARGKFPLPAWVPGPSLPKPCRLSGEPSSGTLIEPGVANVSLP